MKDLIEAKLLFSEQPLLLLRTPSPIPLPHALYI